MYDPAVVDALLRVSGEIAREQPVASESLRVSEAIALARPRAKIAPMDPAISAMTVNMAGQLGEIVGT